MSALFLANQPLAVIAVAVATGAGGTGSATFAPPPGRWTLAALGLQAGTLSPTVSLLQAGSPVGPAPANTMLAPIGDVLPGFGPLARLEGSNTYTVSLGNADASTTLTLFLYLAPCGA
jgi:hypothetical protein